MARIALDLLAFASNIYITVQLWSNMVTPTEHFMFGCLAIGAIMTVGVQTCLHFLDEFDN